jgi:hypothetical protein
MAWYLTYQNITKYDFAALPQCAYCIPETMKLAKMVCLNVAEAIDSLVLRMPAFAEVRAANSGPRFGMRERRPTQRLMSPRAAVGLHDRGGHGIKKGANSLIV